MRFLRSLALSMTMFGLLAVPAYAGIVYVDASASGADDGTSWTDAFDEVHEALSAVSSGSEIWVASGSYMPANPGTRSDSFVMVSGVNLYGGFSGSEILRNQRLWLLNISILSGEINAGTITDNCYNVITGSNNVTLDGFTIERGNSDSYEDGVQQGSALYLRNGTMSIINCIIDSNGSSSGTKQEYAVNVRDGALTISDCTFQNNFHVYSTLYLGEGCSLVMNDCLFDNNTSGYCIQGYKTSMSIDDSDFINNDSGGIWIYDTLSSEINDCIFGGNEIADSGEDQAHGAAIRINDAHPVITNSLFYDNVCLRSGGAIYSKSYTGTPSQVINCTFTGNEALTGSALFSDSDRTSSKIYVGEITSINNIIWANPWSSGTGSEIELRPSGVNAFGVIPGGSVEAQYCNIKTNLGFPVYPGFGNIRSDPMFVGTVSSNFYLKDNSPCIDTGSNTISQSLGITQDLGGGSRIIDGDDDRTATVDMGAYETNQIFSETISIRSAYLADVESNVFSMGATVNVPEYSITTVGLIWRIGAVPTITENNGIVLDTMNSDGILELSSSHVYYNVNYMARLYLYDEGEYYYSNTIDFLTLPSNSGTQLLQVEFEALHINGSPTYNVEDQSAENNHVKFTLANLDISFFGSEENLTDSVVGSFYPRQDDGGFTIAQPNLTTMKSDCSDLPFFEIFERAAESLGVGACLLYLLTNLSMAMGFGFLTYLLSGNLMLTVAVMLATMSAFFSTGAMPFWVLLIFGMMSISLMYVVRRV